MTGIDHIRRHAMALPEVEETSHLRFRTPVWKVHGRTFLCIGAGGTTAVFCVGEQQAEAAAAPTPAVTRPSDARTRGEASSACRWHSATSASNGPGS